MHIATLVEMLNEHTPSVLECFAKLTAKISSEQPFYIEREKAIAILEAGFQSKDPAVRENAARAKRAIPSGWSVRSTGSRSVTYPFRGNSGETPKQAQNPYNALGNSAGVTPTRGRKT
jgi:hypothetical protein